MPPSPKLVKVLHSTLKDLEQSEELAPDDPALSELKGSILSNIIELEVAKTPKPPASPQRILWIAPKPRTVSVAESSSAETTAPPDSQPSLPAAPTDPKSRNKPSRLRTRK